jgi:hypothetical protein
MSQRREKMQDRNVDELQARVNRFFIGLIPMMIMMFLVGLLIHAR